MTTRGVPNASIAEILVVEDNASSLKMLSDLLTKAGYKVRPASDGELGLQSVQAKEPDLILLDFKLPGMDGVEVCRHLKEDPETHDIPVIFISALGDSELKVKALDAGAVDYVTKPIDSSEVLARIKTHLNMYHLRRSNARQAKELRKHRDRLEELVEERTADLVESEKNLAESNQLLGSVLEYTHMLAVFLDPHFNFIWVNRAYADACKHEISFFPGKNHFDLYPHEENQAIFQRVVDTGKSVFVAAKPFEYPDQPDLGVTYWDWSLIPVKDDTGIVTGLVFTLADVTDRIRTNEALQESESRFRNVVTNSTPVTFMIDRDGTILLSEGKMLSSLGLEPGQHIGQSVFELYRDFPDIIEGLRRALGGELFEGVIETGDRSFEVIYSPNLDSQQNVVGVIGMGLDITERKRAERERETAIDLLELLNAKGDFRDLMRDILRFLQELSECEAVGIRLRDGDDFPYYATSGFSGEFVEAERYLCVRNLNGQIERDQVGDPVLDCMCGNIICGRVDPSKSFFTDRGSFVSNHTSDLLATTTEEDRQSRTRNRCNAEGYESVALLPLRVKGETFGLIQFNDRRKGFFSDHFIALAERLADNVAIAIGQRRAEEDRGRARKFMQTVIDSFPESMMVINRDHTIALANRTIREMCGGRDPVADSSTCYGVSHGRETPCDGSEHPCPLEHVLETKAPITVEHVHFDSQGREIIVEMIAAPIFGEEGDVVQIIESVRDITERKLSRESIAASLKEKEVLLREIHHRVKNNMQIIVSMLRMHSRESTSERMRDVFDDCRGRVNAMSLIHEALYQSEDLARIDSEPYLAKLCRNLIQVHRASSRGISLTVGKEDVSLGIDQGVAVGMIVCELVSNSFKHAFPNGETGSVSVNLSSVEDREVELIVRDDGVGLPPEIDIQDSPSLGLHLAAITTMHELGGSIEVERDGGTRYVIRFERKDI